MARQFWVELRGQKYDPNAGWHCSALALPGAKVKELVVNGQPVADSQFQVDGTQVRLAGQARTPVADAALKVSLERKLVGLDTTVLVAILGLFGTLGSAYLSRKPEAAEPAVDIPKRDCILRPLGIKGLKNPERVAIRLEFPSHDPDFGVLYGSIPERNVWMRASDVDEASDIEVPCGEKTNPRLAVGDADAAKMEAGFSKTFQSDMHFSPGGRDEFELGSMSPDEGNGVFEFEVLRNDQVQLRSSHH